MKLNRFMLSACASGSGKTLLTCGILRLLQRKNLNIVSFKCGPDYIDPAFHAHVCGKKGFNLDPFFLNRMQMRSLMARHGKGMDIAVVEGVMGYFDGLSMDNNRASSCEVAEWTDTPVILIVNGAGMSRSVLAQIRGFIEYQEKPCIKGIFLNRTSAAVAKMLDKPIREAFGIPVVGSLAKMPEVHLESRHLGLLMPGEIDDLQRQLDLVADALEKSLNVELLMQIAGNAGMLEELENPENQIKPAAMIKAASQIKTKSSKKPVAARRSNETESEEEKNDAESSGKQKSSITCKEKAYKGEATRVAIARDEAFCFIYEDNLSVLRSLGLEIVYFSPIHDEKLPEDVQGIILYGGYPELYAKELSENTSMLAEIRAAAKKGMPIIGECGGFLYLHRELKDPAGQSWPMAKLLPYTAENKGKLQRFGYITLQGGKAFGREIPDMPAHEFHYYDSEDPGEAFLAVKPSGKRSWKCIHSKENLFLGFPHLYYEGNEAFAEAFAAACKKYRNAGKTEQA